LPRGKVAPEVDAVACYLNARKGRNGRDRTRKQRATGLSGNK
jgi:hypothetical protein